VNVDSPAPLTLRDLDLADLCTTVLITHHTTVDAWLSNTPGSWGALAGQAVLTTRRALGRSLTADERRVVWQALWEALCRVRVSRCDATS
jgi:hypothetical protein